MKKIISILLCFSLLFSFAAFASAEEPPQLNLTASKVSADAFSDAPGQYVNFMCSFRNCSYFESFEILVTYNPEVLEYSSVYPLPKTEVVKYAIDCTVIQPGKLQVIGNNTYGYGISDEFDPFCLKVIGNGDTDISVELVSFKTADGEVEDIVLKTSIENFTATVEPPQLTLSTSKMRTDAYDSAAGVYVSFRFAVTNCPDFENFQVKITYNPEVLELYRGYPFDLEAVERNSIEFTQESDGTVIADGLKYEYAYKGEFDPFCLKVIGAGDTNISVELVSFRTADGEVENVKFDADIQNFTVEEAPQLTLSTSKMRTDAYDSAAGLYVSFRFAVANCPDFESFRVKITYNPEVLELYRGYPFDLEAVERNSIEFSQEADGTVFVDGLKYEYAYKGEFDPFCLKVIGAGDTNISVELVSFRTTDGEVENVKLDANIQNFCVNSYFTRYDLDGDDVVTAEDARLALRFAVGLDIAKDAQCRAVGVANAKSFTSEDARFILRAAVGLESNAKKVVTDVYWSADTFTGYIVYIYSDGSYDTIGPLDVNDRPDWI